MRIAWLALGCAAAVAAVVVIVVAVSRAGFAYVYFIPAGALLVLALTIGFESGRRTLVTLGAAASAISVVLLVAGWGIPLSVAQTEAAVKIAHPNFRSPIRCHRIGGGGLTTQRYLCSWRGSIGEMGFDVNDSRIVAEYP